MRIMKKTRKNRETKGHISIQPTMSVTVSSSTNNRNGYIDKFMTDAGFTARLGKQVCISEETHERVMKLVSVIGKGQISMASYIENIINEHFSTHAAEIKAAFEEGIKAYRL